MNEEDLDFLKEELFHDENFEKAETGKETKESAEELKYPQEYGSDFSFVNILDDSNGNKLNDLRAQAMSKRSTHKEILFS